MPRINNPYERQHINNLAQYAKLIDQIFKAAAQEAAAIGVSVKGKISPPSLFSFDDYPLTQRMAQSLLSRLANSVEAAIVNGIEAEWTLANNKNSALSRRVFGDNVGRLTQAQYRRYFSTNDDARQAFLQRKEQGLNLSERVWRYANEFKDEMELGIDVGIRNGLDADAMSRELRQYLRQPDKLFRRVRDEHGNLALSKRAADFHPGQGVYRSSYKNARRLAVTETNIAYRTADYERMQQLDFVVGIEVRLSNNHPMPDICDDLCGRYPKDFKFTGWHPHCRCHIVTILKTEKELMAENQAILNGEEPSKDSVNRVNKVHDTFNEWVANNKERAKGWEMMPYFIRDNPQYIQGFEVDTYLPVERVFTRARRTNEAMAESLGIYLQSKYPEIPNTEKAAIYHYTQGNRAAYRQLNYQLRKGNMSEFNEAFSVLLSDGLSKIPPTEATVYRTVRLNKTNLRTFYGLAETRAETTFKGFTSTSLDRGIVMDFAAAHTGRKKNETDVLLVIQGKSGHPIEDFSQFGGRFVGKRNQQEVLFDKGSKFRFNRMKIEDGCPVFYLTEI